MKTSYFAKPGIQENPDALSIALYPPRWWGKERRYPALAPTGEMLKQAKETGVIYSKQEYFDLLNSRGLDPAAVRKACGCGSLSRQYEPAPEITHRKGGEICLIRFYEITSAVKGQGSKMVEAVMKAIPKDWQAVVVMDWSQGFWEKMEERYPNLNIM